MDGLIYRTLEAVRAGLKLGNPNLRIELYDGVFDEDALDRILTQAGTVHLTFLEASPAMDRPGGEMFLNASYGAYVATNKSDRTKTGVNALEALAAGLLSIGRDIDFTMPPYTMPIVLGEMQNLFSKAVGDRGIALYGMSFAVPIVIGQAIFAPDQKVYDPSTFTFQMDEGQGEVPLDPADTERLEPAP